MSASLDRPEAKYRARVELEGILGEIAEERAPLLAAVAALDEQAHSIQTALDMLGAPAGTQRIPTPLADLGVARAAFASDSGLDSLDGPGEVIAKRWDGPVSVLPKSRIPAAERMEKIVAALVAASGPLASRELAQVTGLPIRTLKDDMAMLRRAGKVQAVGHARGARWGLTVRLDAQAAEQSGNRGKTGGGHVARMKKLREVVIDAIRFAGEDGITELWICERHELDRDEVALATGELLTEERVTLTPDGVYRWR